MFDIVLRRVRYLFLLILLISCSIGTKKNPKHLKIEGSYVSSDTLISIFGNWEIDSLIVLGKTERQDKESIPQGFLFEMDSSLFAVRQTENRIENLHLGSFKIKNDTLFFISPSGVLYRKYKIFELNERKLVLGELFRIPSKNNATLYCSKNDEW